MLEGKNTTAVPDADVVQLQHAVGRRIVGRPRNRTRTVRIPGRCQACPVAHQRMERTIDNFVSVVFERLGVEIAPNRFPVRGGRRPADIVMESLHSLEYWSASERLRPLFRLAICSRSQLQKFPSQRLVMLGQVKVAHFVRPGLRPNDLDHLPFFCGRPTGNLRNRA